jgi:hypothetical protein
MPIRLANSGLVPLAVALMVPSQRELNVPALPFSQIPQG